MGMSLNLCYYTNANDPNIQAWDVCFCLFKEVIVYDLLLAMWDE